MFLHDFVTIVCATFVIICLLVFLTVANSMRQVYGQSRMDPDRLDELHQDLELDSRNDPETVRTYDTMSMLQHRT